MRRLWNRRVLQPAVDRSTAGRGLHNVTRVALATGGIALVGCSHIPTEPAAPPKSPAPAPARAHVPNIPTPSAKLLTPPVKPVCTLADSKPPASAQKPSPDAQSPSNDPDGGPSSGSGMLAASTLLEFERDCYRDAEVRVRHSLNLLQKAVRKTKSAINKLATN